MGEAVQSEEQIRMIYREHYKDVYQFLLYFTGHVTDAEDLTQDVFLRVLKALDQFDGRSSLKTWILSIAKHVAIDQHRRKKFTALFSDRAMKDMPAMDGLPEATLDSKEERRHFERAITRLKPQYRAVVILHGVREFSFREVAEILGCKEAKAKSDYYRALKKLQEGLGSTEGGWQNATV